jgi:hypothetical protein
MLNKNRGFKRNNNCLSQKIAEVKTVRQIFLKNIPFYPETEADTMERPYFFAGASGFKI